jgi:peptidoglycan/xylan/chitin deacetylase (PgdA/CDA1 family)
VTGSNLQFEVLQRLSCTYRAPYGSVNRAVDKHFDEFLLWLSRFYDVSSRSFNIPDEYNI